MRFVAPAVLIALLLAIPTAFAASKAWHLYRVFVNPAPVEGGTGSHSARLSSIVLPDSFKVRQGKRSLTFGPVGACKSTGMIAPALVSSTKATAADVLAEQLTGGTTYADGLRGDSVFRVAKYSGGAIKALYVRPTRIPQTWIVVRATTTPHGTCHTGGVRESLGFPLGDAFATIHASGF